jgi:5-methylthioadenosine/S-adenosylhomocysteine deaminase
LRTSFANHQRLRFSWAPHAPYSVSENVWLKIRDLSNEMKVPIHTHLHETKEEVEMSEKVIISPPFSPSVDLRFDVI